jgi:DNA replication protein DnaC
MKFNREVYESVKADVRSYLENVQDGKEQQRSILFYGDAGMGKTYLMKELEEEFSETGYEKFRTVMPWTPQNMTRNRWSNDFVVATTDKTYKSDPRFKVFAFSE